MTSAHQVCKHGFRLDQHCEECEAEGLKRVQIQAAKKALTGWAKWRNRVPTYDPTPTGYCRRMGSASDYVDENLAWFWCVEDELLKAGAGHASSPAWRLSQDHPLRLILRHVHHDGEDLEEFNWEGFQIKHGLSRDALDFLVGGDPWFFALKKYEKFLLRLGPSAMELDRWLEELRMGQAEVL